MKRKIFSLALALMMIVSVTTALPVSATTGTIIDLNAIEDVEYSNSNMLRSSDKTAKPSTTIVSWDTAGRLRLLSDKEDGKSAVWTISDVAAEGNYEIYASAALGTSSDDKTANRIAANQTVSVSVNEGEEKTATVIGTDGGNDAVLNSLGIYSLVAGENTLQITYNAPSSAPALCIFDFRLVKTDKTETAPFVNINAYTTTTVQQGEDKTSYNASGDIRTIPSSVSDEYAAWISPGFNKVFSGWCGGVSTTVTAPEAGYYDVLVAAGVTGGSEAEVVVDNAIVAGTLEPTATNTDVAINNLGRIYLDGTTQELTYYLYNPSGQCNTFDIRLEKSANQAAQPIIINARYSDRNSGTSEISGYTKVSENQAGWANSGSARLAGDTNYVEYDVNILEAGYYNVFTATGSGDTAKIDLYVDNTKCTNGARLIDSNSTATGSTWYSPDETFIARVYLEDGPATIKLTGGTGTGAYYLYNIKLEKVDVTEDTIRITDKDDNVLSSVTAGSTICAEFVSSDTSSARLFLVQYEAVSGDIKKLVATSYSSAVTYTLNGKNFYTTTLNTRNLSGYVKAFLWKDDGSLAPLEGTIQLDVN